jgi:hypothetical protein
MLYKIFILFVILFLSYALIYNLLSDDFNISPLYFIAQTFLISINIFSFWKYIMSEKKLLFHRKKRECLIGVNTLIINIRNTTF